MSKLDSSNTAIPGDQPEMLTPESAPSRWRRGRATVPVALLILGLLLGGALGAAAASSDPTKSTQYKDLQGKLASTEAQVTAEKSNAEAAQSAAAESAAAAQGVQEEAAASQSALAEQAKALSARESAVSAAEKQVEANSIGEGTWTVGTDVRAGTYRTSAAVSSECYWSITKSGTNGSDIIENDIPTGGFPTVVLRPGQDFTNHGCGTFVKK